MVGRELGAVIRDAGVKQCELSKRARLNASVVSEILSGKRIPTEDQVNQIVSGMEEICAILKVVNELRVNLTVSQKI